MQETDVTRYRFQVSGCDQWNGAIRNSGGWHEGIAWFLALPPTLAYRLPYTQPHITTPSTATHRLRSAAPTSRRPQSHVLRRPRRASTASSTSTTPLPQAKPSTSSQTSIPAAVTGSQPVGEPRLSMLNLHLHAPSKTTVSI